MKKVSVSVTNDLATDQRVKKVCGTLTSMGFHVTMTGIRKPTSLSVGNMGFATKRFRMFFRKGFLFYAEYNLKLFFFLLFRKYDLLVANDLDTLLPNYIVSRLKRIPLVYDSHEYFLGSTEIENRKFIKGFWQKIERWIFPELKHVFTVNDSIASLYEKDYGIRPLVLRNLPRRYTPPREINRKQLGLPEDKKIVLMQGGAINIDRGAEELIQAMQPKFGLKNVVLYFIGGGDVWEEIRELATELQLTDRVFFIPKMPYDEMMKYTSHCDIGVTLDKAVSTNYALSLPNKLFDYLAAGLPVLASPMTEVRKIVEQYDVGKCADGHDPRHIANTISAMLDNEEQLAKWKKNALEAASVLCWENEEEVLRKVYAKFL